MAHGKALYMGPSSRVFQFSAFMWDISVCETITTLIHGGCIAIPSESSRLDDTIRAMNDMEVTWAWFTPSFARSINLDQATSLRPRVLGGEIIGQDNIDRYRNRFHLLTGYGPTECCIAVSVADFSSDIKLVNGNIGRGIGVDLWLTDPNDPNTLLPPGTIGEILMEGPSVGRGYIEDPERTAEAFISGLGWAAPLERQGPRRFYRSGDLGRLNPDGSITFLGRKDDQVKVSHTNLKIRDLHIESEQTAGPHGTYKPLIITLFYRFEDRD